MASSTDEEEPSKQKKYETSDVKLLEIKEHLKPIRNGSTLLVPNDKATSEIQQKWLRFQIQTKNKMRILATDNRVFEGVFHCIDSDGNIILKNAYWINAGLKQNEKKIVGSTLITRKWITKLYLQQSDD